MYPGFHEEFLAPAADAPGRATLAVDLGQARGPASADERLTVDPAWEVELLWALRAAVQGRRLEPPPGAEIPDWPSERIRGLAARLASSRYGVLFYEAEPPAARREPLRALALGALARDANPSARLRVLGVRPPGNAAGAEAVLTWQTGYPSAVDFARGYPRFGPGEYDAASVLRRGETDAVLLLGPAGELKELLGNVPVVVIGAAESDVAARVTLPTRPPEHTPGSWYRMDGLALRRRLPESGTEGPTDEAALRRLIEAMHVRGRA